MVKTPELPIISFASQAEWTDWLAQHHDQSTGLWMKLAKKDSGIPSVTYDQAVESALCYGWIDGLKKSFDHQFWLQKFTPRGPKSIWSKINVEKAEKLIASGQMQPAGLKTVEAAKLDGRWEQAYESQKNMGIPEDFQRALDANPTAREFFATLKSASRYSFLFRIQTAKKAETRAKRIEQFIAMLERGEKFN